MATSPAHAWWHAKPGWVGGGGTSTFAPVQLGGGGFVTGMSIAADGTTVCRVDVFNAYTRQTADTAWTPLFTPTSMPGSMVGVASDRNGMLNAGLLGCYEIAIAPSNTNIFYALVANKLLRTTDRGANWTILTNFSGGTLLANGKNFSRGFQKKMAVDPANADHLLIGTPINGLYRSTNATGVTPTFTQIATVPLVSQNMFDGFPGELNGIAFDTTSGTTGGRTNTVYLGSFGNGVYRSTDQGQTWAVLAGGPTGCADGICNGGIYYSANCAISTYSNGLYSYNGSWHTLYTNSGWSNVTINPFDATWVAGMANYSGNFVHGTLSAGGTVFTIPGTGGGPIFNSGANPSVPPSDVGWLANTRPPDPSTNWASSGLVFDPITANRVWMSWGYGVSYFDLPNVSYDPGAGYMLWTTKARGIENLVAQWVVTIPGASYPIICVEDQQFFDLTDPTTPPAASAVSLGSRGNNCSGWQGDWSRSNLGVACVLATGYYVAPINFSGYTTNSGASWTQFPTHPTTADGGDITCVDSTHFVMVPFGTAKNPIYTTNGGSTWTNCSGLPAATYFGSTIIYENAKVCTNDAGGNVYVYLGGGGVNGGTYKSTDKGATFTHVSTTDLTAPEFYFCEIQAVPGTTGHLTFSLGETPSGQSFYLSTNGGTTWAAMANVQDVWCHGYGAVAPGFTDPTLWIVGWKSGVLGIWKSRDMGVSDWTRFSFPLSVDQVNCIGGDGLAHDKCYIGFGGSGYWYGTGLS